MAGASRSFLLKTSCAMESVEPLSDDATRVAENLVQVVQDAPGEFIKYETEAFDDFVVECHEGAYFPLPPEEESIESVLFLSYQRDLKGTLESPLYRLLKHQGKWYPFGYKDGGLGGVMHFDLGFLTVEEGSLELHDRSSYATKEQRENDDRTALQKYDEVRDHLERLLPVVEKRYRDVEPTEPGMTRSEV